MVLELCMRRTYGKDALYGLLLTFGAALVIEEMIRLAWGSGEKQLLLPPELSGAMLVGGLIYAKYRLYASLAAIVLIAGLWIFLRENSVRRDDQGRRARLRDGARARHQPHAPAPVRVRARHRARRGRRASCSRRSGACGRTWASTR